MKGIVGVTLAALFLLGCSSKSANIQPSYVSPLLYSNYSCEQLALEAQRVSSRAAQVAGVQDSNRTSDAVATTVGVVLFWPALFMVDGDGQTASELARLKGEADAIEQASIQKQCNIRFEQSA